MASLVERVKQYRAATGCTLREAHDAVLAGKKPRADLCADPALLAEAVEVLKALIPGHRNPQGNCWCPQYWNRDISHAPECLAARAFLAKLENSHDR